MPYAQKLWPPDSRLHAAYMIAMLSSELSYRELAQSTGISKSTLGYWRYRLPYNIRRFERVLGAVGYDLTITRKEPKR